MAKKKQSNEPVKASQLEGFKYLKLISELFETLHDDGTLRDKAGNRELYFDQYAMLMLLYFFNPILTSLRGTQKTTSLEKVQKMCGIQPTSLGSLSEASRVFDPKLLEPIITKLAKRASTGSISLPKEQALALQGLTAIDGSLLPALPKMAWALLQDAEHRAAKMHVAFAVVPGAPVGVTVTSGNASE